MLYNAMAKFFFLDVYKSQNVGKNSGVLNKCIPAIKTCILKIIWISNPRLTGTGK